MFFIVFYAGQFFVLSAISALIFFAVRRLRPYTLYAFMVPLGFGASAIVGVLAVILLGGRVFYVNLPNWTIAITFALTGLCGAVITIYVLNFLESKIHEMLQSPSASRRIRPF